VILSESLVKAAQGLRVHVFQILSLMGKLGQNQLCVKRNLQPLRNVGGTQQCASLRDGGEAYELAPAGMGFACA